MKPIIKFRGTYSPIHEWAYGDYYNNHEYGVNADLIISSDENTGEAVNSIVNYPFINQFTGLVDKDGKELYEDDLFKCETDDIIYRVWRVKGGWAINTHVQIWQTDIEKDYPFPLIPLADEQTVSWFESSCLIIGNIHNNPEYLKCGRAKKV